MCRSLTAVIYLWAEWHKQQAFHIIQLWLHSDSQRWAVQHRGGGSRSFPLSSPRICPASVDPLPPLAVPRRRSWGGLCGRRSRRNRCGCCSEALLCVRGYTDRMGFFLGLHTQMILDKNKLTEGMLAPYTGDILFILSGLVGHYGLKDRSGLLLISDSSRDKVIFSAGGQKRKSCLWILKWEHDLTASSLKRYIICGLTCIFVG